jgi:hypothetical protein
VTVDVSSTSELVIVVVGTLIVVDDLDDDLDVDEDVDDEDEEV